MTEQWFLDLDGVRSGPYQTPEVMSLISEGEVLPHHRISMSLKDAPWMTILDWRLDQARTVHKRAFNPETLPPAPEVGVLEIPTAEPIREEMGQSLRSEPSTALDVEPVEPPHSEPLAPAPETHAIEITNAAPPLLKVAEPLPEAAPKATSLSPPGPKRDPMAEMFDMLQNTKQKREAKLQQTAPSGSSDSGRMEASQPFSLRKMLFIGTALALIGFTLGQFLQQSTPEKASKAPEVKSSPTAAPELPPKNETPAQVIDRSNDKLTIKAVVPKKEEAPTQRIIPSASKTEAIDRRKSEREIEELNDLKKELQELKSMKDQLKSGPDSDDLIEPDAPTAPEGATPEGAVDVQMQPYPSEGENPRFPAQPSPGSSGVHY